MKAEQIALDGKDYFLIFNGSAKFAIDELCGDESIVTLTQPNTREAIEYLYKAVSILAEQGELVRRHFGYDRGDMLTVESIQLLTTPTDNPELKLAVYQAITRGYGREIEDDEKEVDLVLQELEKKTGNR